MIVTSRAAVPVSVCDLRITIEYRNFTGHILYLGLVAVLTVDADLLPAISIPRMSTKTYKFGDDIELFGLDHVDQLIQKRTQINTIDVIPTRPFSPTPRWRISNTEGIFLPPDYPYSDGGILFDPADKSIIALWMNVGSQSSEGKDTTWKAGLSYDYYIRPIIALLQAGEKPSNRCCGWEFEPRPLATAIDLGLGEAWASRITHIAKSIGAVPRPIFVTGNLRSRVPDDDELEIGDVLLEINGKAVGRMADVRSLFDVDTANVRILRNGQVLAATIRAQALPSQCTSRLVCWAGAIVHQTHDSVLEQTTPEFVCVSKREGITNPGSAAYINFIMPGSPATRDLLPFRWILEINGQKVRTLDDMVDIVSNMKRGVEYVRVRVMDGKGIISIVSVRLDYKFWPSWMLERNSGEQWVRTELGCSGIHSRGTGTI
jgi:hypothetical protein